MNPSQGENVFLIRHDDPVYYVQTLQSRLTVRCKTRVTVPSS